MAESENRTPNSTAGIFMVVLFLSYFFLATEALRHGEKKNFATVWQLEGVLKRREARRVQRRAFLILLGLHVLRGSRLLCFLRHHSTPVINDRDYEARAGVKWLVV